MTNKTTSERDILAEMRAFKAECEAKGPVGVWSGHDGLTSPVPVHPDADKTPRDTVTGSSITARKLAEEGRD